MLSTNYRETNYMAVIRSLRWSGDRHSPPEVGDSYFPAKQGLNLGSSTCAANAADGPESSKPRVAFVSWERSDPSGQFFSFVSVGDFANCANPSNTDFTCPAYGPFGSNCKYLW